MSDLAIGDPKTYRETFAEGLTPLLDTGAGLGAFILAFNNAAFDAELRRLLSPRLEQRFVELADELRRALRRGSDPAVPTDDLAVFLRMLAVGYQDLPPVDIRRADPWEVQKPGARVPAGAFVTRASRVSACRLRSDRVQL